MNVQYVSHGHFTAQCPCQGIPFANRPFQALKLLSHTGLLRGQPSATKGAAAALHCEQGRHSTNREVLQTKQDKQLRLPVCSLHWDLMGFNGLFSGI